VTDTHTPQSAAQWIAQYASTRAHLVSDSRGVFAGDVFFAFPGHQSDGRRYITQALAAGACAVVVEAQGFDAASVTSVPVLAVADLKRMAGTIAAEHYGHPSQQMQVIGVTGTNGKTTCTQWLAHCLSAVGIRCAVIGTLGIGFPGALTATGFTTPQAVELQRQFASLRAQGAQAVAIEVSSIGLAEYRLAGTHFSAAALTNLTRDHLDYHGSMEAYEQAKRSLFAWPQLRHAVINLDDAVAPRFMQQAQAAGAQIWSTSLHNTQAHVFARDVQWRGRAAEFSLVQGTHTTAVKLPALGAYNVANALTVATCMLALQVAPAGIAQALASVPAVAGRMHALGGERQPLVVVDYAHTPDALANALAALRPVAQDRGGRLACVFGCGGDRDPGKRPEMGRIAAQWADTVFVTSDNPRSEEPAHIVQQILAGITQRQHVQAVIDRREAIIAAIEHARVQDVVLVAGKGHETYQEIAGVKHPFSDVAQVQAALQEAVC
jgi:UDP-N-acetylmuramyl-tripeptide synthetase